MNRHDHLNHDRTPLPTLDRVEHVLLLANAQNLVARWNNIIISADTGETQLTLMKESGVFADDIALTFDFGETPQVYTGLDAPKDFFNSFVDPLKKKRFNIASNVEALAFEPNQLHFRFKHWIFMNETLSLTGNNEAVMEKRGQRYVITKAHIRVIFANLDHAY